MRFVVWYLGDVAKMSLGQTAGSGGQRGKAEGVGPPRGTAGSIGGQ